jgi:DNA-binding IclR family transcriptional regulator
VAASRAQEDARRNGIQVIARVAEVLRALEHAPEGLSLSEIAVAVGLPKSTVHRLVGALEAETWVTPASAGKVRLGRGLARLGAATRNALRDAIRPQLMKLHRELEETVDLAVLDGASVRFIDHLPAPHRLRAVSAIGATFPLYCTANGKALLAAMPEDQAVALLPARLPPMTPNTIAARKDLMAELEEIRATGVGYDREEHTEGICAVGAVVYDPYGPAGAISIPMPAQRFVRSDERVVKALLRTCQQCSRALGGE